MYCQIFVLKAIRIEMTKEPAMEEISKDSPPNPGPISKKIFRIAFTAAKMKSDKAYSTVL
jgi:hypothetical protein